MNSLVKHQVNVFQKVGSVTMMLIAVMVAMKKFAIIKNGIDIDTQINYKTIFFNKFWKKFVFSEPWMFACGDGKCIYNTWRCGTYNEVSKTKLKFVTKTRFHILDGDIDCNNGTDENNCTHTSTESSHKIDNVSKMNLLLSKFSIPLVSIFCLTEFFIRLCQRVTTGCSNVKTINVFLIGGS